MERLNKDNMINNIVMMGLVIDAEDISRLRKTE